MANESQKLFLLIVRENLPINWEILFVCLFPTYITIFYRRMQGHYNPMSMFIPTSKSVILYEYSKFQAFQPIFRLCSYKVWALQHFQASKNVPECWTTDSVWSAAGISLEFLLKLRVSSKIYIKLRILSHHDKASLNLFLAEGNQENLWYFGCI